MSYIALSCKGGKRNENSTVQHGSETRQGQLRLHQLRLQPQTRYGRQNAALPQLQQHDFYQGVKKTGQKSRFLFIEVNYTFNCKKKKKKEFI